MLSCQGARFFFTAGCQQLKTEVAFISMVYLWISIDILLFFAYIVEDAGYKNDPNGQSLYPAPPEGEVYYEVHKSQAVGFCRQLVPG